MFKSVEHAISTAYFMLSVPIEGKNSTQVVIENLRERFDPEYLRKPLSELTPHEWHAQAVMTLSLVKKTLYDTTPFHAIQARFGSGIDAANSTRVVSVWLNGSATGTEREITDLIASHILIGRPSLRSISARYDLPFSSVQRLGQAYRTLTGSLISTAIIRLEPKMQEAHLLDA